MSTIALNRRGRSVRRTPASLLALIFFGFTYALFSYRALLRYGDAYELFSPDRLTGTLVGAGIYWLVLDRLIDRPDARRDPLPILLTILPASIVVLLARLLIDQFISTPADLALDLRFVMVWAGYFGLWVSASLALRIPRTPARRVIPLRSIGTSRRRHRPVVVDSRPSWDSVIDWLSVELTALPAEERALLMDQLDRKLAYEPADPIEAFVAQR